MDNIFDSDAKSDIELIRSVLEILYGRPKNELADRLVKRFGTAARLFDSTEAELAEIKGMTKRVVSFFTSVRQAYRQALIREAEGLPVTNEYALFRYTLAALCGERRKTAYALYTDKKGMTVGMLPLSGDLVREAMGELCRSGATRLAILTNSPSGRLEPTAKTLSELSGIVGALEAMGAEFIDYVTYSTDRFFTLRRMTLHRENPVTIDQADTAPYPALGGFTQGVEAAVEEHARRLSTAFLDLSESKPV